MAGKPGRSGGARIGSGRKSNAYHAAVAAGQIKIDEKPVRAYRPDKCYVYVVHETGHAEVCKIGVALNAARRFSHLQVGTWRDLTLAHSFLLPNEEAAHRVETAVHAALAKHHKRGEWFAVTPEDAVVAIQVAAKGLQLEFLNRAMDGAPHG